MPTGHLYRPARSYVTKCVEKWSLAGDVAVWQVMLHHVMPLWFGKDTLGWNVTCPSLPLCCCLDCIEYEALLVSRSTFSENTSKSDKLQIDFGSEESSAISKILFKTSAWIDIMKLDSYRHPHACNATAGISTNDEAPMVTEISNDWKHGQGLLNLTK